MKPISIDPLVDFACHILLGHHLLELPKYRYSSDNVGIADPKDQWIHFFRYANGEIPAKLLAALPDPIFAEAVGVLEMIARSPAERSAYEARLKVQRDEQARMDYAIEQGKAEGKAEGKAVGELQGRITTLQEVLDLPVLSRSELDALSTDALQALLSNLQDLLRNRKSK